MYGSALSCAPQWHMTAFTHRLPVLVHGKLRLSSTCNQFTSHTGHTHPSDRKLPIIRLLVMPCHVSCRPSLSVNLPAVFSERFFSKGWLSLSSRLKSKLQSRFHAACSGGKILVEEPAKKDAQILKLQTSETSLKKSMTRRWTGLAL